MKETDKQFIANWERIKTEGKAKYITKHGVGFGTIVFALNTVLTYWGNWGQMSNTSFFVQLSISIAVGGGIYGTFSWFLNDFIYHKKLKEG
jgi:hypothetical protein